MKIVTERVPEMTIEEFADANDLVMEVKERPVPVGDPYRYYAKFAGCDVTDGSFLIGTYGNGATPEAAIAEYAIAISLRRIVSNDHRPSRRELSVPRLVPTGDVS